MPLWNVRGLKTPLLLPVFERPQASDFVILRMVLRCETANKRFHAIMVAVEKPCFLPLQDMLLL